MLDNETKRKIDSARSILVGKVPDPKAQVEQITTALIYKFMDDMDRASEELGGVATFVTGELEQFKWAKLMSKELGGEARLILYSQALTAFSKADGIPEIFRTIFKDAFLPYRDPETLNLFLKEIDYFDYDHSENLGDAFEYLLSVLGSQGDAGQFRTPRHIIDFIVEVLEPKKSDSILDPSCGTAGFLISAYKHIAANENLSPVDKKQLMQNFTGYDISPDMVRLSLVNMYLHSFPQPKIHEYDTLTSEDRWNDSFDVILANPPFMTPKGGIRPHSRFSVQANRSEVLFVYYIAEHLNLNGRAGIIVPEGIIFQSANAYKALRKMLVENDFLWAVVSLPAGVFQPYSGVKTSILLLDRAIAKKNDSVLFVKISNDGYDLGAQRREIANNDLIPALEVIKNHRKGEAVESPIAQLVLKSKIAESGDYNLTGERYKETKAHENLVYPLVKLGDICDVFGGYAFKSEDLKSEKTSNTLGVVKIGNVSREGFLDIQQIQYHEFNDNLQKYLISKNDILIAMTGATVGKVAISQHKNLFLNQRVGLVRTKLERLNNVFVAKLLCSDFFYNFCQMIAGGGAQGNISTSQISEFQIPLPPLEIQNAIVAEIEQWQKVIDGAKQVVANYRPTISIQPDWEMVKLGDILRKTNNNIDPQKHNGKTIYIGLENIESNTGALIGDYEVEFQTIKSAKTRFLKNQILYGKLRPNLNKVYLAEFNGICSTDIYVLDKQNENISTAFYSYFISSPDFNEKVLQGLGGAQLPRVSWDFMSELEVPYVVLETQNAIVEQIEKERAAVESCKNLIVMFEYKIKRKIGEVWGEAR